jgi:hypothetical protein
MQRRGLSSHDCQLRRGPVVLSSPPRPGDPPACHGELGFRYRVVEIGACAFELREGLFQLFVGKIFDPGHQRSQGSDVSCSKLAQIRGGGQGSLTGRQSAQQAVAMLFHRVEGTVESQQQGFSLSRRTRCAP